MGKIIEKMEGILEWGGIPKDITCLVLGGISLVISIFDLLPLPFDAAWIAIILCGLPIIMEAVIGLITAFDIKADVLVSLALIASVLIGEDFAAGEVAFIMQLGALLEDLTVSKARAGIEKLVHQTPQTARVLTPEGENIIPSEQVKIGDRIRVLQKSRFLDVEAVKEAPKPQNFFERKWEAFTLNWLPYLWRARDTLLRRRVTPRAATSGWQTGNYPGGEGDG